MSVLGWLRGKIYFTHCAMESREMLRGPKEVQGGTGGPMGSRGIPLRPLGCFDGSSADS